MMNCREIKGLQEVCEQYQGFIIDLWGVMHDGVNSYPASIKVLEELKELNKKVIFLSNAPRRSKVVHEILKEKNISRDLYIDIICSGEVLYHELVANRNLRKYQITDKYYYIGPKRDENILEGANYNRVDKIEHASFIVVTGLEEDNNLDPVNNQLKQAIAKKLPLFCANPDIRVVKQDKILLCAGAIASIYEELGGDVYYFGKPYIGCYQDCFQILNLDKSKILAIGDSFETDIQGAVTSKIDSLMIAGGIYKEKLLSGHNISSNELDELTRHFNIVPSYIMDYLKW